MVAHKQVEYDGLSRIVGAITELRRPLLRRSWMRSPQENTTVARHFRL